MNDLIEIIKNSEFLSKEDKDFLLSEVENLNPIEKLRIKHNLQSNKVPPVLEKMRSVKSQFLENENNKEGKENLVSKLLDNFFKTAKPEILSNSILSEPTILGGKVPIYNTSLLSGVKDLEGLDAINELKQIGKLETKHVTFLLNQNGDQVLQNFKLKLIKLFDKIDSFDDRRLYLSLYLHSSLFINYINTGLTALRHYELQPANIVLNTLHQIDSKYLDNKQFKFANELTSIIKNQCAI
jgi:hypothetical protein